MTTPSAVKDILIVGGSYAGLQTAHFLLKHVLPTLPANEYHVTLVDRSTHWFVRTAAPRGVISETAMSLEKLFMPIVDNFKSYSQDVFSFIQATAKGLDTAAKTVSLKLADGSETTRTYYSLVIATGASPLTPLLGATGLHTDSVEAIKSFRERLASNPPKSIVIAGGGPAGIETAGELGEFLNGKAGFFASKPQIKTKITVVTSGEQILTVLSASHGKKAEKLLNKVGVDVVYKSKVVSTVPENAGKPGAVLEPTKVTLDNGETLEADLYIPAVGTPPNTSWIPANLLASDKRVETNQQTFRVEAAGPLVYAIGDSSNIAKGGLIELTFALPYALANLKRDLVHYSKADADKAGQVKDVPYSAGVGQSQIVPIAHTGGVGAFKGWSFPSFMVWLIKGRDYLIDKAPPTINGESVAKEKTFA